VPGSAFGKTADAESLATVHRIGTVKKGRNDKPLHAVVIERATVKENLKG
jgi:hypothetical protein